MNTFTKLIADLSRDPDPSLRARAEELHAKLNAVLDVACHNSLQPSPARASVLRSPFSVFRSPPLENRAYQNRNPRP